MKYTEYLRKIKCYSENTVRAYAKYVAELRNYNMDYESLLLSKKEISRNTIRIIASAIISYFKFIKDERWKEIELPKREFKFSKFISYSDYQEYLKQINRKTKMGLKKRIVTRLLFETGVRSSELLSIEKKDIQENKITINGKGKKQRVVFVSKWLQEEIEEYLDFCESKLFDFGYKNLYIKIQSLDKSQKITPHMFRRGYAKYCHENGISIYDISLSMGHSSVETTASYIKRSSEQVQIFNIFS